MIDKVVLPDGFKGVIPHPNPKPTLNLHKRYKIHYFLLGDNHYQVKKFVEEISERSLATPSREPILEVSSCPN